MDQTRRVGGMDTQAFVAFCDDMCGLIEGVQHIEGTNEHRVISPVGVKLREWMDQLDSTSYLSRCTNLSIGRLSIRSMILFIGNKAVC